MGVLPAGPDRDRDRSPVADTTPAPPEGSLSQSAPRPADLRDQLAQVGEDAVRAGLVVGSGGNLSAREPGADCCWVTGSGTWLDRLTRADFAQVRIADGTPVGGPAPSSELALHLHTYRVRPDVNAVVHVHPQSVLLLDALGVRIRLVTTDHTFYLHPVLRTDYHPPGSVALARAAAAAVRSGANCVILGHHGCSVLGSTVELAHRRVRNLEEAAWLTYRALAVGRPDVPECPLVPGDPDRAGPNI